MSHGRGEGRRYAVVGTGHRSQAYVEALLGPHAGAGEPVAWCEPNPVRMDFYDDLVRAAGRPLPARYEPDQLEKMIEVERVDAVVVTSPDHTHADLAVRAMEAGADVVLEQPLSTDLAGCRRIVDAAERTGRAVVVASNHRYAPRNTALKQVIASGEIGDVTSVHVEWLLDTVHGADYFRRWHRRKDASGGLLVHTAAHHFDLVNWWLGDLPSRVYASGALRFYGAANARARGLIRRPVRGTGRTRRDPFALDLRDDPRLERLYLQAEEHDGYLRDRDVFTSGITIEDNLAVVVDYARGATLTYSLHAHAPWEGYRVAVNGTAGRAELEVVERGAVVVGQDGRVIPNPDPDPGAADRPDGVADDGASADGVPSGGPDGASADGVPSGGPDGASDRAPDDGGPATRRPGERLVVQRHWGTPREITIEPGAGGDSGGDALMLADVFGDGGHDPLGRAAGLLDGVRSVVVGIAGNRSLETGLPVRTADLRLDL